VADNVSKFQGLLVGSIFVHVPFMVRAAVSEGERISLFRATEELMLRCGSAFTEVLLLGRNLVRLYKLESSRPIASKCLVWRLNP
jgi:ATP-binding cassette subfamily D (ALD) long-chain fatty acid import protein